jgi:tetratricopeptide (TPR) repeat protein
LGQLEKNSPSQLYGLGLSLLWQGKQAEAEKALLKVLEINPQAVPAYTQLAFLYDKQGKTRKAIDLLKRGHEAAPRSYDLGMLLSAAYMDQKDYARAEAVYKDALAQGEGKTQIRFQMAVLYDKWDKFPKAEAVLKDLLQDEPKNAQALNYLGYSWVERGGDLKQAEALIRRALEIDPGNAFYEDSLGWALFKEGDSQKAAEVLQGAGDKILKAAEKLHPDGEEAVVLDHLSTVRSALGQVSDAERAKAAAESLRKKALEKGKEPADPAHEPDL